MTEDTITERFEQRPMKDVTFGEDTFAYRYTGRDKFDEKWSHPVYQPRNGESVYELLQSLAKAQLKIDSDIEHLYQDLFIDSASDDAIERYGEIVDVRRRSNESIDEYKTRVRAAYNGSLSESTFDDVAQVILDVLGSDPSDTKIGIDPSKPVVVINTQREYLDDIPFEENEIISFIEQSLPAAHSATVETFGSFEFSAEDYEPPEGTGFGEGTFGTAITE